MRPPRLHIGRRVKSLRPWRPTDHAKLHAGKPGRIVLAYLNPGQAESYRRYWTNDWKAPTATARGTPDFMLIPDPDGWDNNYNVIYWDKRWQEIMITAAPFSASSRMIE